MKSVRLLPAIVLLPLMILSVVALLPVQEVPAASETQCRDRLYSTLQNEFDLYRLAVFGGTGSAVTQSGVTVLKTGGALPAGDRMGILETKYRITSELIDPLVESYRTLRCRSQSVCEALERSISAGENVNDITVQTLGCEPITQPIMGECRLSETSPQANVTELMNFCKSSVAEGLTYERAALKTAVAYDAGYRSLLQFAGMFDAFLQDAPVRTFLSLRQMAGLLGKLHEIPCFTASCDLPSPLPPQ